MCGQGVHEMGEFYQWVKDIFIVILSLTFFQILLPHSSLGKYVKFIFSLLILIIILQPLTNLLAGG